MRIKFVTAIWLMVAMLSLSWGNGASAQTYSPGFSGGERMGKLMGGGGGGPFQLRCPPGENYLAGLEVTTNERISTVKLICAPRQNDQLGAPARFGPDIGVPQSGRYSAVCPNGGAVNGIDVFADGYDIIGVWNVDLRCGNAHGALPIGSPQTINFQGSAQLDKLTSSPRHADGSDECPPGYIAKGVWGRYGVFIDAIGLICDWPPPNAPPAPPPPPVVYKHTGSGAPKLPPAPFTGTWRVTSSLGDFDLGMLQVSTGLIVGSISDGNARDAGTVRGVFSGQNRAHLGFTQSGLGRQGSVDVTLRSDGLNFQGLGTVTGSSTPITWSADRPPPAPQPPAAPRVLTPGPFFGDWQVAASDGTQFPISLTQKTGGLTTAFTDLIKTQPPGTIRAYTMNKTHAHVNFTMGGAKGQVELEIGPDGQSFIGAGYLADGTPITWSAHKK